LVPFGFCAVATRNSARAPIGGRKNDSSGSDGTNKAGIAQAPETCREPGPTPPSYLIGGGGTYYKRASLNVGFPATTQEATMNGLIYLIGLIVVIMFVLSFLGLH
jgi:hypothetical protein